MLSWLERTEHDRREDRREAEERQQSLILELRRMEEEKKEERNENPGLPVKLRMEGIPRWPPLMRKVYPFCIYAEDLQAAMKLLGLAHVMTEPGKETKSITAREQALALRYITASVTDSTIQQHLASR